MMKTKNLLAVLVITIVGLSTMNAQKRDHSKIKKDSTKMDMKHSKIEMKAMYTCPMHADVTSEKPGECPKCGMDLKKMKMDSTKMDHSKMEMNHDKMMMKNKQMAKMYVCPMHADVKSEKPGKCPKCGMELKEKKMELKKKLNNNKNPID